MKSFYLFVSVFCIFSISCKSQGDSTKTKTSYFKIAANYLSNAVYSGRTDSSVVPYLRPSIGYYNKSGFFIAAGMSILVSPSDPIQLDLISADIGYEFSINDKLAAGISASKYVYSDASFATASELKGAVGVNLSYDVPAITVGVGSELYFSTNTDINANINLSHSFALDQTDKWKVIPTLQVNAGTQYFNQAYYQFRKYSVPTSNGSGSNKGKGHSHGGSSTGTVQSVVFTDQKKFALLDYELSLPLTYDLKNWGLFLTPFYVLPTSAATYAINGQLQREQLSNTFFVEAGVYLKLRK